MWAEYKYIVGNILKAAVIVFFIPSVFAKNNDNAGRFNATSCTGTGRNAICVAVGYRIINGQNYPLIVKSIDGGLTYDSVTNISGVSEKPGTLLSVFCSGELDNAHCNAVGYLGKDKEHAQPLLLLSQQQLTSWQPQTTVSTGLLTSVSCYSRTACVSVGYTYVAGNQSIPIIIQSDQEGKNWKPIDVINMPMHATLAKVNCSLVGGQKSNCAAIGYDLDSKRMLVVSNVMSEWRKRIIGNNVDESYIFTDIICPFGWVGCQLVGRYGHDANHYRAFQTDVQWYGSVLVLKDFSVPKELPNMINAITCRSDIFVCSVGGYAGKYGLFGEFDLYNDRMNVKTSPANTSANVIIRDLRCTASHNICMAVGEADSPVILTKKGAHDWFYKTIADVPARGALRAMSCTQDTDLQTFCLAAGYRHNSGTQMDEPLLVQSTLGGERWTIKHFEARVFSHE